MTTRWLPSWRRNRLFRKYVVPFVAVVCSALLANGLLEIYFTYQETKTALGRIQREKALAAAIRIEQFVKEIERQIAWTTLPQLVPMAGVEQRRLDFLRLLRQVPAITEVAYLDPQGREQLRISRLAMDAVGSAADYTGDPRYRETRAGRPWYGPVYFRKESEPYLTLAVPHGGGAVTVADVNLKFIWDVVSQIRVGKLGHAYVVDGRGQLIAHPDISLVLKKTDLSGQPAVQAAQGPPREEDDEALLSRGLDGRHVLIAYTAIAPLGWLVFVEQPLIEAFAPLRGSMLRTGALMLIGVFVSMVASLVLAGRMARPIEALHTGAARIGAGDLAHRIDVRTGDELQALATEFNRMTAQLQESYATLEHRVEARTRELTEALEQQTATSEILRVISSSPTDVRPVFEAILASATRLCAAQHGIVFAREADGFHAVACRGLTDEAERLFRAAPVVPSPDSGLGRMAAARRVVHVEDVRAEAAYERHDPLRMRTVNALGARTAAWLPLLKGGEVVGALAIYRQDVRPFTDAQLELVRTFTDQAVIAIQNVRLFEELERKNAQLSESLSQQTATADILRVISESPSDVTPVLTAVTASAARLCAADNAQLWERVGDELRLAAKHGNLPTTYEVGDTIRITRDRILSRAVIDRAMVYLPDLQATPDDEYLGSKQAVRDSPGAWRTGLAMPLLREDRALGVIFIRRADVRPFAEVQIQLLQTFADQAAIAIENVRLFKELEARNAALTESLDQQTATSDILRVISSSPTDLHPVMEALVGSAAKLCEAQNAQIFRVDGDAMRLVARYGPVKATLEAGESRAITPRSVAGRSIVERTTICVPNLLAVVDAEYPDITLAVRQQGIRTTVGVPLLREGIAIGAITAFRTEVRPFTDKQIALLQTFADQAVIAIENVRLFQELEARNTALVESLERQTATGEILRVISGSLADVQPAFEAIARNATHLSDAMFAGVLQYEGGRFHLVARDHIPAEVERLFPIEPRGLIKEMLDTRATVCSEDVPADPRSQYPEVARAMGYRSAAFVPLLREDVVIGAIMVGRHVVRAFGDKQLALLRTFADQAVIAIENVRLFNEIQAKTRELEAANRHKDEFLASMSHELRTPLNAVIGFSEVLLERMFGELNDKQEEYLADILSSGRHLLSLINDILDLAKIEAGRMELELEDFELAPAIDNALVLIRERATRKSIALETRLAQDLGSVRGDQRKIKQVLLNLLSNAVKFTPEGGRIEVRARRLDGHAEIAVADTGIGIAPEDQPAVFEEFRQVGTDYSKKHEGTGLGLALSRKFVELHGGRLGVQSALGHGSTFTFTIPVQPWQAN